jgi:hypothetical protein
MSRRSWQKIRTKVSAMGADEIRVRTLQEWHKRTDLLRYRAGMAFHEETGPSTSSGRFFFDSSDIPALLTTLQACLPRQVERIIEQASAICEHRFCLLGHADLAYGAWIDWHFDPVHKVCSPRKPWFQIDYFDPAEVGDPKIIWELNRLQHFVVLAKAYRFTGEMRFADEILAQWRSWQAENPYPLGINWSSSLEVAFRSMSLLWVFFLLKDCPVVPARFAPDLLRALSMNGKYIERYLSTYSSPNTHLLGEGVGLFFIGTLCPQLRSASHWQRLGWEIVLGEARNQVRADGFHFEQSTYYHVYALDFFLHARILAVRNGVAVPSWFDRVLENMLQALSLLSQAGAPPAFGDDDGGRVFDSSRNQRQHLTDPLSTGAVLFGRSDWKSACCSLCEETIWLLGAEPAQLFDRIPSSSRTLETAALKDSGLYVMADTSVPGWQMVIDGGPQGAHSAGHGHADSLSIHLNANGHELLCDPGAFEYGGDPQGRNWFRSTRAHNTMRVDGLDQAEMQGPFGWSSLPNTYVERWIEGKHYAVFRGSHTGYHRLNPSVTHERWVLHFKSACWLVRDVAIGDGEHDVDISWHFGPGVTDRSGAFTTEDGATGLVLRVGNAGRWSEELCDEWWSPAYGTKKPSKTLHHRCSGKLPVELATLLVPAELFSASGNSFLAFGRPEESAHGFCYATERGQYGAIFAQPGKSWSLDEWASDADLLCYRFNEDGLESLLFCKGTFLNWQSQRLVGSERSVAWCELVRNGASLQVTSAEPQSVWVQPNLDLFPANPSAMLAKRMQTNGAGR